jgi:hypothetical protein
VKTYEVRCTTIIDTCLILTIGVTMKNEIETVSSELVTKASASLEKDVEEELKKLDPKKENAVASLIEPSEDKNE